MFEFIVYRNTIIFKGDCFMRIIYCDEARALKKEFYNKKLLPFNLVREFLLEKTNVFEMIENAAKSGKDKVIFSNILLTELMRECKNISKYKDLTEEDYIESLISFFEELGFDVFYDKFTKILPAWIISWED